MKHIVPVNEFFKDFIKKAFTPSPVDYDFKGVILIELYSKGIRGERHLNARSKDGNLGEFYNNGFDYSICNFGNYILKDHLDKLSKLKKSDLEYKLMSIIQIVEDNGCEVKYYLHQSEGFFESNRAQISIYANSACVKDLIDYLSKE